MPVFEKLNPSDFNGALRVKWFKPNSNQGEPADLSANAYLDDAGITGITIAPAAIGQTITVNTCGPAPGIRCNLEAGTGLLLAENLTNAPLILKFAGAGVLSVGAFLVSTRPQVPFGSPFTPQIWVEINNSSVFENFRGGQGVTGDIWTNPGDSVAPFVGAVATGGDRITSVLFDAVHPTTLSFDPLGIGHLYCTA
jgi:hypothetical protein